MISHGLHRSLWQSKTDRPTYPRLTQDIQTDVVIIGAGITGLTTALLLKRAGKNVVILERESVGYGTSGNTTAHISTMIDHGYRALEKSVGTDGIRLIARSLLEAVDCIEQCVKEYCLDCSFRRVQGYYYTEKEQDVEEIRKEYEAALAAGLPVTLTKEIPLPFPVALAIQADRQGQIHASSYLDSLSRIVDGDGGAVFEHSPALRIVEGEPVTVETEVGSVKCNAIVHATHTPLGINVLHTAVAPYRSYALAAQLNGPCPDGLYWDTEDPYNYIRKQETPEGDLLIVGGKDHKTAHGLETEHFDRLEAYTRSRFDVKEITHYWSSQYYDPVDGIPFIGKNPQSEHAYIATGFSGDGIPFGTLSGIILADLILDHENQYAHLYRPVRIKLSGVRHFLAENLDVAKNFLLDRLTRQNEEALQNLAPETGAVLKLDGQSVAAYRDSGGALHTCSAVCTHMKCIVHWNEAEKTFDCPCHGARYDVNGKVLEGPTTYNLSEVRLKKEIRYSKAS